MPRADMPLVQAVPEIRTLDVNVFHTEVRFLEDTENGIIYQTEENVFNSGIVARTPPESPSPVNIRLINEFKFEPEDGQYQVNLIGGNSNILANRIQNQVSMSDQNFIAALTDEQNTKLCEMYKAMGLDRTDPWNVNITSQEAHTDSRDIELRITGDGITTNREERLP